MIAKNYLQTTFHIDLMASIPIEKIAQGVFKSDNPNLQLFGILKMGRFFRLNRIIRLLNTSQILKVIAQLSYIMIFIFIYLHWYACIFWILVKNEASWIPYYL